MDDFPNKIVCKSINIDFSAKYLHVFTNTDTKEYISFKSEESSPNRMMVNNAVIALSSNKVER